MTGPKLYYLSYQYGRFSSMDDYLVVWMAISVQDIITLIVGLTLKQSLDSTSHTIDIVSKILK